MILAVFSAGACGNRVQDLQKVFSKPEYQATADHWGEARRRKLLAQWLETKGVKSHEFQSGELVGKYRRVTLRSGGKAPAKRVTLALNYNNPGQAECDRSMFAYLPGALARGESLDFVMTESCIDLTAYAEQP